MQKLAEFAEQLDTKNNKPTNILNNLCTGLEKFLGFNPSSKGYDGQGIVYSDLDRLCDGVMGFLSGVLSNIKDHLGQHKDTLNDAITSLETNKHRGKNGFNVAIEKVVAGVRGYNAKVKRSNDEVKRRIETLYEYVKKRNGKLIRDLKSVQVEDTEEDKEAEQAEKLYKAVNESLKECQKNAATFSMSLDEQTVNIDNLNAHLKRTVNCVRDCVKRESARLTKLAEKEGADLKNLEKAISETLEKIRCNVNDKISIDVKEFFEKLKTYVQKMWDKLREISNDLAQHVKNLTDWMATTKTYVEKLRSDDVRKIVNETTDSLSGKTCLIDDQRKEILKWKDKLEKYISQLKEFTEQVDSTIKALAKNFGASPERIFTILEHIKGTVLKIKEHIGVNDTEGRGPDESIQQNWDKMKEEIEGVVQSLVTDVAGDSSLVKIVNGSRAFAGTFRKGDSYFGKILEEWMTEIVSKEPVNGLLQTYVKDNNGSGYFNGNLAKRVPEALRRYVIPNLKEHIRDTVNAIAPTINFDGISTAEEKLSYIKTYLNQLCSEVIGKEGGIVSEVSSYLGYQPDFVIFGSVGVADNTHLTLAVKVILAALASIAKHVAKQLDTFRATCSIPLNLENAIEQVRDLGSQLESDKPGVKIDLALAMVTSELDTLYGELDTAAPDTGGDSLSHAVDDAIKKVRDTASELAANSIPYMLNEISRNITEHLEALKNAVEKTTNAVQAQLVTLNDDMIGKRSIGKPAKAGTLQHIQDKFTELHDGLVKGPMKEAQKFVLNARLLGDQYIKQMHDRVDNQVKYAGEKITTQAKKQYVTSVKEILIAFAEKVYDEIKYLPDEIANDLTIGHKGFMAKLEDKFIKNVNGIKDVSRRVSAKSQKTISPFSQASGKLQTSLRVFFEHLRAQADYTTDTDQINSSRDALNTLLEGVKKSEHFDHMFRQNLDALIKRVNALIPSEYGVGNSPLLLEYIREGLLLLVTELDKAYVNSYAGKEFEYALVKSENAASAQPQRPDVLKEIEELTDYGRRCARVCLTIVPTLVAALTHLKNVLESNNGKRKNYKIYDLKRSSHSLRTLFFGDNGYDVGLPDDSDYGELNHRDDCTGGRILGHLTEGEHALFASSDAASTLNPSRSLDGPTVDVVYEHGVVSQLHNYLALYFNVRHFTHIPKPRLPCNIYEMLQWCSGLQFNAVYDKLHKHCASLFEKRDESTPEKKIIVSIPAYPRTISRDHVDSAIHHITSNAYYVLTGLLGHGDDECGYACEFSDNSLQLKYPTSGEDCLSTLLDLLRRLFPALQFLERRCSDAPTDFGWGDCLYGKGVRTSNAQCNDHSSNEVTCKVNCKANTKPNYKANCQPTSPLMSYLNDCLPGHLPHNLIDVGCQSTCKTCPNNLPGQPCITPLGFRGFSSSVKTGRDLRDIIHEFFDHEHLPALFCLTAKPPSTLPEHFEFTLSLVRGWRNPTMSHRSGIKQAVESLIGNQSIDLYKNPGDLTSALTRCYGADCSNCEHPHITNLTSSGYCNRGGDVVPRAPYLSSLCSNTYLYLAEKHSNAYLSWCIYLPWNFHKYLEMLLKAFSDIFCGDWGCRSCLRSANCKRGKHGHSDMDEKTKTDKPYCQCTSVVTCIGVAPTLYSYGFSFADTSALNEEETRKTCTTFYDSLKEVIKSQYFTDLFKECDMFLWRIREPFSYLVLALWLLSLLYLLHIMVIRLDLLHIKSHLHSPSSHRIAAQSLLAAGRVNKLNRVFYLQP